jgi:hypothetical protein
MGEHITSREYTHMMSKGFAVGAALLVSLVPFAARADYLDLFGSDEGFVTVTSPTSFSISAPYVGGVACWYFSGSGDCGDYAIFGTSVTALSAASPFEANIYEGNDLIAQLHGTFEWTAVEGYPASPELVATFTSEGVSVLSPDAAKFAADFPAGSVDPITLTLAVNPQLTVGCPSQLSCYFLYGEIVPPVPSRRRCPSSVRLSASF